MRDAEVAAALARLDEWGHAREQVVDAHLEMFRRMLEAQRERFDITMDAADRAVTKAEAATERRFDSVNEFRAQLADQAAHFASRESVEAAMAAQRDRTDTITDANRELISDESERTRVALDEVKAQSTRLLFALGTTIIGTLLAATIVAWSR